MLELEAHEGAGRRSIAVRRREGRSPGFLWLGGYRSDMSGTKAARLDEWCAEQGHACCRFDYSGHGESGGRFEEGTISVWLSEALAVMERFTSGPQILVGSSMGGWIALRMAQELSRRGQGERLHAMLLIAPAPDFTERLMWPQLDAEQRREIEEKGRLLEPSQYSDEPNIYTRALFEDGRRNLVMEGEVETGCPVHILQGRLDPDVPWTHAVELAGLMAHEDVSVTLVHDGDHRLSRDCDIELLLRVAGDLAGRA